MLDQRLLFGDEKVNYPEDRCLHELITEQAARTPEAIAVVFEGRELTYVELMCRSNQLAHYLITLGVGPDVLVGLLAERSIEMIVGMLGILKAGGAYLPLDPSYPNERLSFMLEDSEAKVLLKEKRTATWKGEAEFWREIGARLPVLEMAVATPQWAEQPNTTPDRRSAGLTSRHLAYVIYTSGTTGRPKGVMIEHRSVVNYLTWMQSAFPLRPEDAVVQKTPFTFDASVWEFYAPLLSGSRMIVASPEGHRNTVYLSALIQRQAVHTLQVVPSLLGMLLDTPEFSACTALKRVFSGGEALPANFAKRFYELLPHAQLINLYGPTETTIYSSFHICPRLEEGDQCSIGRPIGNTQIYILDENGQSAQVGEAGDLYISGDGLARGYRKRPELTAEKFVQDPFKSNPGARMYKTGDRARWQPNLAIDYLGRNDSQIKIQGFRIEPGEIESALERHPAVRTCVVTARHDEPAGQRLVAYVAGESLRLRPAALNDFLKTTLPFYMIPSAIVVLEEFPLNSNGKIDRHALPEPVANRKENSFIGPRDTLEAELIAIWEKALGIRLIGVRDDFFQIGGRSIHAVRIFKEIDERLGKSLPLATLFQMPTVEKLAVALRHQGWNPVWSPMVAIQPNGTQSPFFSVHGGFGGILFYSELARCLGSEQPLYGLQAEGLDGGPIKKKSVEAMASAYVKEIRKVQRHGPYFLGGYSFGGFVAFEMAHQLKAAGETVALVALFDTDRREGRFSPTQWLQSKILQNLSLRDWFSYFFHRGGQKIGASLNKVKTALVNGFRLRVRSRIDAQPIELSGLEAVQLINKRALANYKMRSYSGRLTLFRVESAGQEGEVNSHDYAWTPLAKGGLEIRVIPGEHESIFSEPHVRVLAEKLEACIEASTSEVSRERRGSEYHQACVQLQR